MVNPEDLYYDDMKHIGDEHPLPYSELSEEEIKNYERAAQVITQLTTSEEGEQ